MTELDQTAALVRAFIASNRRDRYLNLLASSQGRAKLRRALAHLKDLDPEFAQPIPAAEHTPEAIATLLRSHGAPDECVLLAEDEDLDGLRLPLEMHWRV